MRGGVILPFGSFSFQKMWIKWLWHGATHDYAHERSHVINAASDVKGKLMAEFSFQV
jgi:hypothetical protein